MRELAVLFVMLVLGCASGGLTITVDGKQRSVDASLGFEEFCSVSGGYWWTSQKDGAMAETVDGAMAAEGACDGCMPNKDTMLCTRKKYINYVKLKGVDTEGFSEGMMEKKGPTGSIVSRGDAEITINVEG